MILRRTLCLLAVSFAALGAAAAPRDDDAQAARSITPEDIAGITRILSSDAFEGRGPATRGEELTLRYLEERFAALGLRPGNGNSYLQEIPLTEIASRPAGGLAVKGAAGERTFEFADEFVALSRRAIERVELDGSDMVFAGYGIVAPEYGWNDYRGLDVRGKTVVVLVNDPGFATKDVSLFHGESMTYYGRWTYKYEEAARQGAAAVLIVHETEPAAYPWGVVQNSFTGPQMYFRAADGNASRCAVEGWLTVDAARELFRLAGLSYDEARDAAARRGFEAMPLGLEASLALDNAIRDVVSSNVAALLRGSARPDECVIYMAHWDHLGIDTTRAGDQIFNGALDNATGVAGLLELAEAFTKLEKRPARSILFLSVTCEEQGLLGSEYYAEHPLVPLDRTVAALNMDALNIYGPMKDITEVGYGNSELDDYLVAAAAEQGRSVTPDPDSAKGTFFRSDHFSLAQRGVPVLYVGTGTDHVAHGTAWTKAQRDRYILENYHKPSDEYDPMWDLRGMVDDLRLLFAVGHRLASETTFPRWKKDSPYQAARDKHSR